MRDTIRRLLLLDVEQKAARSYGPDRLDRIRTLAEAARRRHRAAHLLSDEDQLSAAALLDREATKLMMAAILVANGREVSIDRLDAAELIHAIRGLVDAGGLAPVPELSSVAPLLEPSYEGLRFDELAPEQAIPARAALGRVAAFLSQQLDVRSPREIRAVRRRRIGAVLLVLLALSALLVANAVQPRNLALYKPVATGMSTAEPIGPFAIVDLEAPQPIGRIVVRGRDDCCQNRLPVVLELSTDGATFTEVDRHTEPFSFSRPWTVHVGRAAARFVRVRVDGPAPDVLSVRELEVYAR